MALNLTGLASGVDTDAIVAQLMALERQGAVRTKRRETAITARDTGLKDVRAKLSTLKDAAADLRLPTLWKETQRIAATDPTKVGGTRTGAIAPGTYEVTVTALAATERRSYTLAPSSEERVMVVGGKELRLAASAGVSDAAAAINRDNTYAVTAAVSSAGELVLTSRTSGVAGGFSASGGGLGEVAAKARPGADASYSVNGGPVRTSPSNAVADSGVPGLGLTLKATGTSSLTVGEDALDTDAIKGEIKAFVEAYNAALSTIAAKTAERKVPAADADTNAEIGKGQLFADRGLTATVARLRQEVADPLAGNPAALDELAEIGVSTGRASKESTRESLAGSLVLDEAKLDAALQADPYSVQRLLGGVAGVAGLAQRVETVVGSQIGYTQPDGRKVEGLLEGRLEASQKELKRVRDQQAAMDKRLEGKEKRLRAQFAAMEAALAASQTQSSWLNGQLAAL